MERSSLFRNRYDIGSDKRYPKSRNGLRSPKEIFYTSAKASSGSCPRRRDAVFPSTSPSTPTPTHKTSTRKPFFFFFFFFFSSPAPKNPQPTVNKRTKTYPMAKKTSVSKKNHWLCKTRYIFSRACLAAGVSWMMERTAELRPPVIRPTHLSLTGGPRPVNAGAIFFFFHERHSFESLTENLQRVFLIPLSV